MPTPTWLIADAAVPVILAPQDSLGTSVPREWWRTRTHGVFALLLVIAAAWTSPAVAQGFTCRIGTSPACLDYGETICSSRGMCVDENAICLDRYQCDYEGFTCKSNLTDCGRDYETLLNTHNNLVDDYNRLLADHREVLEFTEALNDDVAALQERNAALERCLRLASSLMDAADCLP